MAKNVSLASMDQKLAMAKNCSHEGVVAGAKAAIVASVATGIPTYTSLGSMVDVKQFLYFYKIAFGKMSPWARTYLNPTAKALIVSTVAGMAYFVVADKTVLKTARKNSFKKD